MCAAAGGAGACGGFRIDKRHGVGGNGHVGMLGGSPGCVGASYLKEIGNEQMPNVTLSISNVSDHKNLRFGEMPTGASTRRYANTNTHHKNKRTYTSTNNYMHTHTRTHACTNSSIGLLSIRA